MGIFWETFIVARLNGGGILPSAATHEQWPERLRRFSNTCGVFGQAMWRYLGKTPLNRIGSVLHHWRTAMDRTGFSLAHAKAPRKDAEDKPVEKIPGSARCGHDKEQESTGGNPPSGQEKPELPCLVLFTPRNNSTTKVRREMKQIRRISHGNARAIESLRGLRLSLVPYPDSRECVLQGM